MPAGSDLGPRKIDGKEAEEAQKQVMQLADKDGDGVLSREELDQAKAQIASESPETSPAAPAVETESAKGGEKPAEAEVAASPKDEQPKPESEGEASHYDIVRGTLASILSGAAKRFVETKSFEEIDKDGDGVITKSEIAASLSEMQVDSKEAEEAQKQVMKMADKDGDGVLSREELDQAKAQIASENPETSPAAPAVESEGEASHYDIVRGTLASILSGAAKRFVETKSFEEIDKDGDGVITKSEIAASLSEMQVDSKEAEEAQKQVMKMADKDGDGVLSREELDQAKAQIASENPETSPAAPAVESEGEASHYDIVRGTLASILSGAAKRFVETKSFEEVDKDGDGVITKSEIAASLSEMQVDSKEAEEAQKQVMKMADKDGDGVLSREELDQAKAQIASENPETSPAAPAVETESAKAGDKPADGDGAEEQILGLSWLFLNVFDSMGFMMCNDMPSQFFHHTKIIGVLVA